MTAIPGLFIVGTDTGVGKTRIAAAIARSLTEVGHIVGVLKPVATGAVKGERGWRVDDADQLTIAIGGGIPTEDVCPIAFTESLAPTVAARRSGSTLLMADVIGATLGAIDRWQSIRRAEVMVIEGVGGLLCPLAEGMTVADLAVRLDYPLVIVARRGLGTLNHTLLTVEAALNRSLRVAGLVLNGAEPSCDPVAEMTNPDELSRWLGSIPILANLSYTGGRSHALRDGWIRLVYSIGPAQVPLPNGLNRGCPMSSHDALHPESGTSRDSVGDPFARQIPPSIPKTQADDAPHLNGPLESSGSGDNLGSFSFGESTRPITPDPLLGVLADVATEQPRETSSPTGQPLSRTHPDKAFSPQTDVSGELGALAGLKLDKPIPAKSAHAAPPCEPGDEEVVYVMGPNWTMLLLSAYASAVTMALIWLVVIPKFRAKEEIEPFTPSVSPIAVGTKPTGRSEKVEPAAPIPPGRIVKLGQSLKIGSLEFTPLGLTRQAVKLRRDVLSGGTKDRDGGSAALALLVKMRNTSEDAVFPPLDRAFIRDKDSGGPDSFVELANGDRVYLYPLPVESEWSIIGQEFPNLRPGEVKETRIITSTNFPTTSSGMTWRLRLRTGLNSTEVIGVSISADK